MRLRLFLLAAALLAAGNASAEGLPPGYAFAPAPAEALGKQVSEATGQVYTDTKGWYRLTYGVNAKAYDDGRSTSFAVTTDQGAEVQLNFSRVPLDKPITDLSFDQIQAAQAHQFDPHSDMERQLTEQTVKDRHIMMLGGSAGKPLRLAVWVLPQPDDSVLWLGVAAGNKGFLVINAAGPNVQAIETYLKAHLQIAEGFVK